MRNIGEALLAVHPDARLEVLTAVLEAEAASKMPTGATLIILRAVPLPRLFGIRILKTRKSLATFLSLVRYLRKNQPDALLTFQAGALAVLAARLACYRGRIVIRESSTPSAAARFPTTRLSCVKLMVKRLAYRRADAVITLSRGAGREIVSLFGLSPTKVTPIPNPVRADQVTSRAHEPVDHPWFGETSPCSVLVSVGRISGEKDYPTLIRAFALVNRRRPDSRLLIVGDGHERRAVELVAEREGVGSKVQITGWVDNPYKYISRAKMFVLSPKFEGLGNVYLEALACGTPVVSTDAPYGPREVLMDGRLGQIVPVGDAEAFAAAIMRYLDHPEIARGYVDEACKSLGRFAPERVAQQYWDVLSVQ